MYLGDVIAANGRHDKNVLNRKNKGLGIINQIMQILQSTYYGKYYFEVALVLRESLLLSSLLLNSEAWVNLTEQDIRKLEQTDEILLSKILDCEANTNNIFKYLELGVAPLRFEVMKRKVLFLQYILQQKKDSMIYKVFEATLKNPLKNDFVQTCEKYLKSLKINLSLTEIEKLTKWRFKKIVKEKTTLAAFEFLMHEKDKTRKDGKMSKISILKYETLELQQYLLEGNTNISKFISKARSQTLDLKTQKKWKYNDLLCSGCTEREESGQEILSCDGFGSYKREEIKPQYSWFHCGSVSDMVYCAKVMIERMKIREKIIENG